MFNGLIAFLVAVTLAMHVAAPERVHAGNETRPIATASVASADQVVSQALELIGGNHGTGGETAPHRHNAPCQDHCSMLAGSPFLAFHPLKRGKDTELFRPMPSALRTIVVPPPQQASATDDVAA